ncbi:MAG: hypothetical protein ACXWKB_00495 [Methyloceanibacter sp.]
MKVPVASFITPRADEPPGIPHRVDEREASGGGRAREERGGEGPE